MTQAWVSLQEAVETVHAASVESPEEVIRRAVSAAELVRGALPPSGHTPPVIRVRVILQHRKPDIEMLDWIQAPVLDFQKSEILCRGFAPMSWEELNRPRNLHPARIEIWNDDLLRLWPAGGSPEAPGNPLSPSRDTTEEACRKLIASLDNSGLTKAVILERAKKEIPDLQLVEFTRAWHNGANLLKKRGRRAG